MNAQDAKTYLENRLPDMAVEVEENYSNQHAKNATRYIFTRGEQKTNLMFKRGFKLDEDVLNGVIDAIIKKFGAAPKAPVAEVLEAVKAQEPQVAPAPVSSNLSYDLYLAAKAVVEAYERDNPMT